mmetsp:Transcript_5280/g.8573  ORF Transcript_5280/g.8573 Transcript_5280/m.8573 type:complete len:122 (-) Transcript_5280:182-547(-)
MGERHALKAKREELARKTFEAEKEDIHLERKSDAILMEIVPNLKMPNAPTTRSLEEMRNELRSQIQAKPKIVKVTGKDDEVYLVKENTYDPIDATVEIFRPCDPSEFKDRVKWKNCKEVNG